MTQSQGTIRTLQERIWGWMQTTFGSEISNDKVERADRFMEEAIELVQSGNYPKERILALIEYVYNREKGEPSQEVGGVMITLGAYCLAHGIDMHEAGETELARIWTMVDKIRQKQKTKPTGSALPIAEAPTRRFKINDLVTKTKGSKWTGRVVGFYSTELTPIGYCVESSTESGSVQIYPEAALELKLIPDQEAKIDRLREHLKLAVEALRSYTCDCPDGVCNGGSDCGDVARAAIKGDSHDQ